MDRLGHRSALVAGLALSSSVMLAGCAGTPPSTSISDARVYTMPAMSSLIKSEHFDSTSDDLSRIMRSRPSVHPAYPMDGWLHDRQRSSVWLSQAIWMMSLGFKVSADGEANRTTNSAALVEAMNELADRANEIADAQNGGIADSAFDLPDRIEDFSMTYFTKLLRSSADSRLAQYSPRSPTSPGSRIAMTDDTLGRAVEEAVERENARSRASARLIEATGEEFRGLFLVFYVGVSNGTKPNTMVECRMRVTGVELDPDADQKAVAARWTGVDEKSPPIIIMSTFPKRSYDYDNSNFSSDTASALALAAAGEVYGGELSGELKRQLQNAERRQFLSRVGKTASFIDAARSEFGWYFYPTNLQVYRRSLISGLAGVVTGVVASEGDYLVNAYLESGNREVSAFVIVPRAARRIDLEVESYWAPVPPALSDSDGPRPSGDPQKRDSSKRTLSILLPPFQIEEIDAQITVDTIADTTAAADPDRGQRVE